MQVFRIVQYSNGRYFLQLMGGGGGGGGGVNAKIT
jgi:hypothetical protein